MLSPRRRRSAPALVGLSVLALAASAAPGVSAAERTASFAPTGAPQSFVVPPAVTELGVTATGAAGGTGRGGGQGGRGATVRGRLTGLVPGQTLTIMVGGAGTRSGGAGFNGGGTAPLGARVLGGGGGGASDVRTCAPDATDCDTLASRLVVAAGGGGSGGHMGSGKSPNPGGDAGSAAPGVSDGCDGQAGGGGAATAVAGGSAGGLTDAPDGAVGTDGTVGRGGTGAVRSDGGDATGGGGGGGLYGGGGGAITGFCGAGGGGGSSLVPAGGTVEIDGAATPSVQLTYAAGSASAFGALGLNPTTIVANGRERSRASVTVLDDAGRVAPGETVVFRSEDPEVTVGATTDHGDGTYTADVVATRSQTARITVSSPAFDAPKTVELRVDPVPTARVTTPESGLAGIRTLSGAPELGRVAGTAQTGVDAVTIGCRAPDGSLAEARTDVPVVDGRFVATDVATGAFPPACRLVALNAVADRRPVDLDAAEGPELRIAFFRAPTGAGGVEWYDLRLPGAAAVATLQDPDRCALQSPTVGSTRIGAFACPDDPGLSREAGAVLVDGAPAYGAGTFGYYGGRFGGVQVPRFAVEATQEDDGAVVVTDRSPLVACAEDRPLFAVPACATLRATGVERVSVSRVAADGLTVRRTTTYRAADGSEHRVELRRDGFPASADAGWRLPGSPSYGALPGAADLTPGVAAIVARTPGGVSAVVHHPTPTRVAPREGGGYDAAWPARTARPGAPVRFATTMTSGTADAALDRTVEDVLAAARPTLDVTSPAGSTQVEGSTVRVTGRATGAEGVAVDVAGTPAAVEADGRFAADVAVPLGSSRLAVRATDGFGVTEEREVAVTRVAPAAPSAPTSPGGDGTPAPSGPGGIQLPGPSPSDPGPGAPAAERARVERAGRPAVTGRRSLLLRPGLTARCAAGGRACTATLGARVVGVRGAAANAGRSTVTVRAGAHRALTLRPSGRALRLLRAGRTVRLRVTATVRDGAGGVSTVSRTVRVRRSR